jgi:uncharacterized membrane protein YbhN (UPF0104 family)
MKDAHLAESTVRRWLWPTLKAGLFAVVMAFVIRQGWRLWQATPRGELHVDWWWLMPAIAAYVAAWLPSVWFWRRLLKTLGPTPGWRAALRAYYIGHLGKYVPGKAMVLVIRAALLREAGCAPATSAVTAMYETLVMMGAGAMLAIALTPLATSATLWSALPAALEPLRNHGLLLPLLVLTATLISLPVIARLCTWVASKATRLPKSTETSEVSPRPGISSRTLLLGLLVTSCGWCLISISLGCVLRGLGVATTGPAHFPVWLAATTLSNVGGFVVLIAPGGLGVRELLLTEVLPSQPGVSEAQAFLAAWLMRAVSLAGELFAAAALWWLPSSFGGDTERSASLVIDARAPLRVAAKRAAVVASRE